MWGRQRRRAAVLKQRERSLFKWERAAWVIKGSGDADGESSERLKASKLSDWFMVSMVEAVGCEENGNFQNQTLPLAAEGREWHSGLIWSFASLSPPSPELPAAPAPFIPHFHPPPPPSPPHLLLPSLPASTSPVAVLWRQTDVDVSITERMEGKVQRGDYRNWPIMNIAGCYTHTRADGF